MIKSELKTVLASLVEGTTIQVCFLNGRGGVNPDAPQGPRNHGTSGSFRVLQSRRGRGKLGSQLATLMSEVNGDLVEIGTPHNDEVINIVVGGVTHGIADPEDVQKIYAKDSERATALKKKLTPLCKAPPGTRLRVVSTEPKLNGTFNVTSARMRAGRWGQVEVHLLNPETKATVDLWTYRCATAITEAEIILPKTET